MICLENDMFELVINGKKQADKEDKFGDSGGATHKYSPATSGRVPLLPTPGTENTPIRPVKSSNGNTEKVHLVDPHPPHLVDPHPPHLVDPHSTTLDDYESDVADESSGSEGDSSPLDDYESDVADESSGSEGDSSPLDDCESDVADESSDSEGDISPLDDCKSDVAIESSVSKGDSSILDDCKSDAAVEPSGSEGDTPEVVLVDRQAEESNPIPLIMIVRLVMMIKDLPSAQIADIREIVRRHEPSLDANNSGCFTINIANLSTLALCEISAYVESYLKSH